MGGGLAAALHNIGDDDNRSLTGSRQLPQRRHPHGMPQGIQSSRVQAVPVLRQAFRVGNGFAGDEHIRIVRQIRGHQAVAVFKIQFHVLLLISPNRYG